MAYRKSIKYLLFLVVFFLPVILLAYDNETTHRAITQEAIKLFQQRYPEYKFTETEIKKIEDGSSDEDNSARYLWHYYDPIHNTGLFNQFESSKLWAEDTDWQRRQIRKINPFASYFGSDSDYSWDRAVFDYVHGDKNRGLEALGHIIHLVEDKAVPDHTRNDAHPFDSPFENFAKKYTVDNLSLADTLIAEDKKPIIYSSLGEYFDNLAKYSNNNFFSKDTIFSSKFLSPTIKTEETVLLANGKKVIYGMGVLEENVKYKIVQITKNRDIGKDKVYNTYVFDDADHLVVSDYWNLLSEQAVLNSAGVIKLFFDRVAEEERTNELAEKNKSFFTKAVEDLKDKTKNLLALVSKNIDTPVTTPKISPPPEKIKEVEDQTKVEVVPKVVEPVVLENKQKEQLAINEMYQALLGLEKQINELKTKLDAEKKSAPVSPVEVVEARQKTISTVRHIVSGQSSLVDSLSEEILETLEDVSDLVDLVDIPLSPIVITPADFSSPFATTSILFEGTSATGTVVLVTIPEFLEEKVDVDENGEWELMINELSLGTTTINFVSEDSLGATSTPLSVEVLVEIIAPEEALSLELIIDECIGAIFADKCLATPTTDLHFSWTISPPGKYTYILESNKNSNIVVTATNTNITINDEEYWPINGIYTLTVYDSANQIIATTTSLKIEVSPTLIINEIAWRGTSATDTREWIELYNYSSYELSLDGFEIRDEDGKVFIQLSGLIAGDSYYLIERGDNTVVSDIPANLISDFSTPVGEDAIPDAEFYLELVRQTADGEKIFDLTPANFNPLLNCDTYDPLLSSYQSVERSEPHDLGSDLESWCLWSIGNPNGLNSEELEINGTPSLLNGYSKLFSA